MSRRGSSSRPGRASASGSGSGSTRRGGRGSTRGAGSTASPDGHVTTKCDHYHRNCNMVAPCCDKIVCCDQGHNESGHCPVKLDARNVFIVVCCTCKASQPVRNVCLNCNRSFGQNGCTSCRMWYSGDGFHCNDCGVCRKGRRKDWWHCPICNTCLAMKSAKEHKCLSSSNKNCAMCGEDTHRSRKPSTKMSCGHMAHCDCFLSRVQKSFSCPLPYCRQTVANMEAWNRALDTKASHEQTQHPSSPVQIYCFNCRGKSVARGDIKKCRVANCGSRNTVRVPYSQQHMPFVLPPRRMPPR